MNPSFWFARYNRLISRLACGRRASVPSFGVVKAYKTKRGRRFSRNGSRGYKLSTIREQLYFFSALPLDGRRI